jgi:glycosyltransferase involved in cell wall biosynthesis
MAADSTASSPQLSIVIACLNAADVLGVQLAALARQGCPAPWEIIVCDNGSGDGTVALAQSWADRLPLRVIDASDLRGSGPARNAGIKAARGQWIGFCDADDEVGDGWVACLCGALAQHPFVTGPFDDERLNSARTRRSRRVEDQTGPLYLRPGIGLPHAGAGNLGVHRSAVEAVGGFDPGVRFLQDTDLSWRLQLAGYPLVFVPDLTVHVRLRSTLRGMYRQGYNFGAAQAGLERRYAQPPGPAATGEAGALSGADPRTARPARRNRWRSARSAAHLVRWFASRRSSIGEQAWQVGWHLGHRTG